VSPTYVSENAPEHKKGSLGTFFQLAITFGMFLSFLVVLPFKNVPHSFRYLFGLGIIPSLLMLVVGIMMPESPAWKSNNSEKQPLIGSKPQVQAKGVGYMLANPSTRRVFLIGFLLAVTQQLTGINALMYYAGDIFTSAGIKNSIIPTIGLGLWNFITTLVSTFLVDRLGRRPLLILGTSIMVASTILVALSSQFLHGTIVGIALVVLLLVFVLGFETGEGPLFWVVATELFPPEVQGIGFSLLNLSTWIFNIMLTLGFPPVKAAIGQSGVFWIFSAVGVVCLALMILFLPETKATPKNNQVN